MRINIEMKRWFVGLLMLALCVQPTPARALDDDTILAIETGLAIAVVVMATTTPLLAAKKMIMTRNVSGVAPESYLNDSISNLFSTLQVTVLGTPNYFAAAGSMGPLLGDLAAIGTYYWRYKPSLGEPFVRVNVRTNLDQTLSGSVVTSKESFFFNKCTVKLEDFRERKSFCEKVTQCAGGLCQRIKGWMSSSPAGKSEAGLAGEPLVIDSEASISSSSIPVSYQAAEESSASSEDSMIEYRFKHIHHELGIRIFRDRVEVEFPNGSSTFKSSKIEIEEIAEEQEAL